MHPHHLGWVGHVNQREWPLGQPPCCLLFFLPLIWARNTSRNYRIQLTLLFHCLCVSTFEIWNTIWHSYQVYKELKPQQLNSIKTRTANNDNNFYPPSDNDWIICTTNRNQKNTQLPREYTRESKFFSIICTYLLGLLLFCSTKCKQDN